MPVNLNSQCQQSQRGFTLLELLVVLAMLGLLGSLAVPSLGKLIDSLRYRSERSSVISQINSLSYRNFLLAQNYTLQESSLNEHLKDGQPAIQLPAGWILRIPVPIFYQFNGYCSGGVVQLTAPNHPIESLRLREPVCGVKDE